jgi:beta-carotene 3-hydroxylase
MAIVVNIGILLASFFFMEFVAWFTHKFVMHGFLWFLHKDHHTREHPLVEWNDLFALIFAIPSILLIVFGAEYFDYRFWIGLGIAAYGLAYFLFHDVLVHQRLPILENYDNQYFRSIVKAHNDHHLGGENFGFILFIPWKYFSDKAPAVKNKYGK